MKPFLLNSEGIVSRQNNRAKIKIGFLITICFLSHVAWAHIPRNFKEAKREAKVVWSAQPETFYCGCRYDEYGVIDFNSCDYLPDKTNQSKKIGWEHVVPASWYGREQACWQAGACTTKKGKKYGGRSCCQKMDERFRLMEADLYNLVPVIQEVNKARSNYLFGEFYFVDRKKYKFRSFGCDLIIDERYQVVEPRSEVKGMIARIHFYMADRYKIPLSDQQIRLMRDWDQRFPPTEWERNWAQAVACKQGIVNPFIPLQNAQE